MSKSPFFNISSREWKNLTKPAFETLLSASHYVALSLEPAVERQTISSLMGSDSSRGRRISGSKTQAMPERLRIAHRQVNWDLDMTDKRCFQDESC